MRNTQMDHTECTPSIQLPNTSYRPRFLQGDHHGNANQNLHLAAVYYNGPDRNQCTGEKSKCFSWDCDWTVQYSIPSQVTTLDCGTISLTSYNVPVVFMSLLNTVAVCSKHFISKLRDFSMVGWLCSLTYMEIMSTKPIVVKQCNGCSCIPMQCLILNRDNHRCGKGTLHVFVLKSLQNTVGPL